MGLGPVDLVPLAEAREKARQLRRMVHIQGLDPLEARKADKVAAALTAARSVSFGDAAMKYVAAHRAGWRNAKHAAQWQSTLATYCHPHIGDLPVSAIDTALVLRCIEGIWATKPETASRVPRQDRGRARLGRSPWPSVG